MKQTEILQLTTTMDGETVFHQTIGKVKNLSLGLAKITNNKLLKAEADDIRDALKAKEPAILEELRNKAKKAEGEDLQTIQRDFNRLYNDFILQPDIQEFLKSENDLKLKFCTLDEKYVKNAGFDSDQIEILMYFTNAEALIEKMVKEEEKSTEPKKLQKRGK